MTDSHPLDERFSACREAKRKYKANISRTAVEPTEETETVVLETLERKNTIAGSGLKLLSSIAVVIYSRNAVRRRSLSRKNSLPGVESEKALSGRYFRGDYAQKMQKNMRLLSRLIQPPLVLYRALSDAEFLHHSKQKGRESYERRWPRRCLDLRYKFFRFHHDNVRSRRRLFRIGIQGNASHVNTVAIITD